MIFSVSSNCVRSIQATEQQFNSITFSLISNAKESIFSSINFSAVDNPTPPEMCSLVYCED